MFSHRKESKCVFCNNTLDDKSDNFSIRCRPIAEIKAAIFGQSTSVRLSALPMMQIGAIEWFIQFVPEPRPSGQNSVVPIAEVKAAVPDKHRRKRLKGAQERA